MFCQMALLDANAKLLKKLTPNYRFLNKTVYLPKYR